MFPWVLKVNLPGWVHLWIFTMLPLVVFLKRRKIVPVEGPLPNRKRHFQLTAFEMVMFISFSLLVAKAEWITLFPRVEPTWGAVLAAIGVLTAQLLYMWPRWRAAVTRKARVVHLFMPSTASERFWWLVVAFGAGIGEEITWRGVQWALLANLTGEYFFSAIICSLLFAAAHMVQGWRSCVVIIFFAFSFHLLVWLAGSLYVAMGVHVAYDVIAGLNYGRLGKALGYNAEVAPA